MNKTTLIIARHGNTFESGETPRRVGLKTDIKLVEKGRAQAAAIGEYLKAHNLRPDAAYSSTLKRTIETAEIALKTAGFREPVYPLAIFDEVDYGPDENKTEDEVIARIGAQAIKDWDKDAKVPDGWNIDPQEIIENWINFGLHITKDQRENDRLIGQPDSHPEHEVVMVVTSNGIARFAPYLTGDFEGFLEDHKIKISTGAICILEHADHRWTVKEWNLKP